MQKDTLRKKMYPRRERAHRDYLQDTEAQENLCELFSEFLAQYLSILLQPLQNSSKRLCGGYLPIRSEMDPRPLLAIYRHEYASLPLLPVVVANATPLTFRLYDGDEKNLELGAFATKHPPPSAPEGEPSLLLVPLLAFDENCKRLGYGGGFYDRTIALLREKQRASRNGSPFFALGIAYEGQLTTSVPCEQHDLTLDGVLTERRLYRHAA